MEGSRHRSQRDYGRDRFRQHRDREHRRSHGSSGGGWKDGDRVPPRRENGKVEQKEQDYVSLRNRSSSLSSSSSSRGSRGSDRKADREPGELSSGSEGSGSHREVQTTEAKVSLSPKPCSVEVKKRKYSPIIWDVEEKVPSKSCVVGSVSLSVDEERAAVDHEDKTEQASGEEASDFHYNGEEDDDYAPTRVLSASRWAFDNNFDGEDAYDEESIPKRKKSAERMEEEEGSLSPELGELREGRLDGKRERSLSGSDEERSLNAPLSSSDEKEVDDRDERGNAADASDRMEVDGEDHVVDKSDEGGQSGLESNSDEDVSVDDAGSGDDKKDVLITAETSVSRKINMLQGCRSVDEFERLNRINEGTYGVVYRARDKKTGEIVALKKVKMEKEREGFPLTSLREINILLSFHHPSIVDVKEVVVGSNLDSVFMVMEYMDHDLKALMETMKQPFSTSEVKCLMRQLLEGVKYLHDNWVLHRDLKTSNLLLNNRGELKICDFGLARQYGSPLREYTRLVVTLWYRAPELLLGAKLYSTAIDMWSLGCIMAELLAKEPLFPGKTETDQLDKIFRILGTPNEKIWPGYAKLPGAKCNFVRQPYNKLREKFPKFTATSFSGKPTLSDAGFDLLNRLLTYDPEKRITADDALEHKWFTEPPQPKDPSFMPTFPSQNAQDRRLFKFKKSPDPLEELRKEELRKKGLQQGPLLRAASLFG
ncbi:cyclin-dependent kinase G-2-like [Nymphaea colorata]|nr:cyclin-dependent kinase G-2-like [Nymphaea colorata]XP_031476336.1 cyclin-dependent kinase G-2-like [Nymphaea colorata]XP_049932178.1 cyclin-dependent kinase G-2-like [Nymphaea colorata]XP_049932179.1 cyclin-dependent kinase G-2-like [Nymphaea colorata]XP_049932180.1 cyclin-dependent kinase G-2-like [Nymphaea colorata]XP_049932181.1 cyclin-dependent kinase G-2-like [Nymphaea colorata]XP_049932182.1 cyclin-dependent kinase G-2-like [Nymphaea colorata]XP_049932183.1 cyclin-dependent kinase 